MIDLNLILVCLTYFWTGLIPVPFVGIFLFAPIYSFLTDYVPSTSCGGII